MHSNCSRSTKVQTFEYISAKSFLHYLCLEKASENIYLINFYISILKNIHILKTLKFELVYTIYWPSTQEYSSDWDTMSFIEITELIVNCNVVDLSSI